MLNSGTGKAAATNLAIFEFAATNFSDFNSLSQKECLVNALLQREKCYSILNELNFAISLPSDSRAWQGGNLQRCCSSAAVSLVLRNTFQIMGVIPENIRIGIFQNAKL